MSLRDCYAIAGSLSKDPTVANKIIDVYHLMSGIDKQYLSVVDAVIGLCIVKGYTYNQILNLI